jgi:biotin carboxylase
MENGHLNYKTIMIFGAGINQLELIKSAREMKITSVVLDTVLDPPGKALADFFYRVDGTDYETTKSIALKHKVNGIVTGQMEKPMRLMAQLAQELGFIFHSPEVVEKSLDKWLMKSEFMKHSVPCAKGILLKSEEVLDKEKIEDINYPVIIKPRDAFSSRGVYKTDNFEELLKFLNESRSYASNGDVIIEEFLEGKEYSVETITWYGETTIIQYTEKIITPYPNTVEMGHIQPADLTEYQREDIRKVVISGIKALRIDNSAAHCEVMLTIDGPKIIEIGARLGGDFISSYLTKASTGISMDKAAVQVALGEQPEINFIKEKYSMIRFIELPVGKTVQQILPVDALYKVPGLVFNWIYVSMGTIIEPIVHSALRPACFIIKADTRHDLLKLDKTCSKLLRERILIN